MLKAENVTCPNCGHVFLAMFNTDNPEVICPDCGKTFAPEGNSD